MPQPTRRERTPAVRKKKVKKTTPRGKRPHPKYGTSKLEDRFAKEFLDKMDVEYERQYEAKEIGRFYDFKIKNGPLIEINGSYWHGDKRIYEEKELNNTQKKNIYVDKIKKRWAQEHCIPIYYIWEKDINENPSLVFDFLEKVLHKKKK